MATETAIELRDLAHAFEEMLKRIPKASLLMFIEKHNLVTGGMRKDNPVFMQKLMVGNLSPRLLTYDKDLSALLRSHVDVVKFLSMISREELKLRRQLFSAFFGKAAFILALLNDIREDVREEAAKWMADAGAEMPEPEEAQKQIARIFEPAVKMNTDGTPTGNAKLRAELDLLKQQLETEKKTAKQVHRSAEEAMVKAQREQKDLLATKDFAIAEGKRRVEQLENALKREQELRELRVHQELSIAQVKLFRGWLKPACALASLLQASPSAPLLERVERALENQRKADRAAQYQHEAKLALEALEKALKEVDETLASAQLITPEMVEVRKELNTQCEAYRATIFPKGKLFSAVARELATRIDACSEADYVPVLEWLRQSERLKVLSADEAKALKNRLNQRLTLLAMAHPELKEVDLALDSESETAAIQRRNPVLSAAMLGQGEMLLFLDGHNILNGISRYRQPRGRPQSHEASRTHLEKDIRNLFAHLPLVSVHLVWDGVAQTNHNLSDNVLVHYSGGTGEHRADRYIIAQMDYHKTVCDLPIVLVTDDNGFAGDARKRGAEVCKLHDFEAFLNVPHA